jgi:hypothetical protein
MGAVEKVFLTAKRKGLRKERKDKTLILSSLRPLRKTFAPFAVNGS